MATFIGTTYASKNQTHTLTVLYNGNILTDCKCDYLEEQAGLNPSTAMLTFPQMTVLGNRFKSSIPFYIYIDRDFNNIPKFVGYMRNYQETTGTGLILTLQDIRCRLFDGYIDKEFNKKDNNGEFMPDASGNVVIWGCRDILNYCYAKYQSLVSADLIELQMNVANIPDNFAGNISCDGKTIGDTMMDVVQSVQDKCYSWRLDYLANNACRLSVFDYESPSGSSYCVLGDDPTQRINNQSNGIATISNETIEKSVFTGYNQVTILSDPIIYETAFTLSECWDSTIETAVLADYKRYTEQGTQEEPNPDYDVKACDVWRKFQIPTITDNGIKRQVKLYEKCISDSHELTDGTGAAADVQPFIVLAYTVGLNTVYKPVLEGFDIKKDKYVIFNKPLFEIAAGSTETHVFPTAVYLNAAYISNVRQTATYPPSVTGQKRLHRETSDGYYYYIENDNFILKSGISGGTPKGESASVEYNGTLNEVRNDYTTLYQYAKDVYKKRNKEIFDIPIELGRIETHHKIGNRIYINNKYTDTVIVNIKYDISDSKIGTTLHGKNGDS